MNKLATLVYCWQLLQLYATLCNFRLPVSLSLKRMDRDLPNSSKNSINYKNFNINWEIFYILLLIGRYVIGYVCPYDT